ncbi:MAG TPA: hypothetical protein VF543_07455 [Pyrinomonadaceae bacterium]|jgi:hypothetical protein
MDEESQSITLLQSEISVSLGEEMLGKAIATTLLTPAQHRAELFELLMQEIAATMLASDSKKTWTYFVHQGTDGSRIFRGGTGRSIVVDPEGRLWRARTYEDFETTYTIADTSCEIDTMKPNYSLMKEYVVN